MSTESKIDDLMNASRAKDAAIDNLEKELGTGRKVPAADWVEDIIWGHQVHIGKRWWTVARDGINVKIVADDNEPVASDSLLGKIILRAVTEFQEFRA